MKPIWLVLVVMLFIISCVPDTKTGDTMPVVSDQVYRQKIVGNWTEEGFPFGRASFVEGGVYKEWVYEDQTREVLLVEIEGRWWIEDGLLFNELIKLIPHIEGFEVGDVSVDEIIDISVGLLILTDENGETYTQFRQK